MEIFATVTTQVFFVDTLIVGVLGMFALLLFVGAYAVVGIAKYLKVWHVLCLAASVRLHGKEFADSQFWWAIKERASHSGWSAKNIAKYAMDNAPKDEC